MDFTEINSRGKRGELLGSIDRQNFRFLTAKTIIIKFGLHASFVELESAKNALNEVHVQLGFIIAYLASGLWCRLDETNNCLTILLWTKSLPRQRTVALLTQWRIVLKGGKTTTVGRRWLGRRCLCRTPAGGKYREKGRKKENKERTRKRRKKSSEKTRAGRFRKRRGESQSFAGYADQESEARMSKNALRTGRRQAVDCPARSLILPVVDKAAFPSYSRPARMERDLAKEMFDKP
ncbi:uncharacterized protein TNCV_3843281 [Trichonephila clavipes]|nr:uncharacterized protein TNCV_3843281 [Trichonephila clavipes]